MTEILPTFVCVECGVERVDNRDIVYECVKGGYCWFPRPIDPAVEEAAIDRALSAWWPNTGTNWTEGQRARMRRTLRAAAATGSVVEKKERVST